MQLTLDATGQAGGARALKINHTFATGTWKYITVTYDMDTGTAIFYVNGLNVGVSTGGPLYLTNGGAQFRIGSNQEGGFYHDGNLDEVRVWSKVRTQEEIQADMNRVLTGSEEGLEGYWRMENNYQDLSPNGNHLTPFNNPTFSCDVPWGEGECIPPHPESATSSVAFLPGIMGSRLYVRDSGGTPAKKWESIYAQDIGHLGLDAHGVSVNKFLYTRDIIDVIRPLTGLISFITAGEGYAGWIDFMDDMVAEGAVPEWKVLPYDWRLATDHLITAGEESNGGDVNYVKTPLGVPYLLKELNALADRSPTGKVTIVAHSNGGLVAKNLLKYLEETHDPLLTKIDTVVLAASPQLGTPKAVREILHGIDMPSQQTVRDVLKNMPGAYGLLPSERLVAKLPADEPLVEIDQSVSSLSLMKDLAGRTISTYGELASFLRGDTGTRQSYHLLGYLNPNKLNTALLEKARTMHNTMDEWSAPETVRVIEIVGTGLWTPRGVHYSGVKKRTENGTDVPVLRTEWRANMFGDGTVLAASAAGGQADLTYYVDLAGYNENKGTEYQHGTILSTPIIQSLLAENVFGANTTVPFFMNTTGTKSGFPRSEIRAYSPVDLHLYRDGKHTGVLSDAPTDFGRYYEVKVPNSHYEEWVDVKYLGVPLSKDGVEVVVDGTGTGFFSLAYDLYEGDTLKGKYVFVDVPVTKASIGRIRPHAGTVPEIEYDINGDGNVDLNLRPTTEGTVLTVGDLMSRLRAYVRTASMPAWLRLWIDERLAVSEKLIKKGGKGDMTAAKVIVKTVQLTVEIRKGSLISSADAEVLRTLLRELVAKL